MVCKRLEKIQRDFLWGGGNLDKNPHLVKWASVCTNKKAGGLGVRGLYKLNKALLGKWVEPSCSSLMPFLALSIWNLLGLLKVGFFAWEASWGKMFMLDQLKGRGRPLGNRCYLCENEEETIDHLLVHYPRAHRIWELILSIVVIGWVFSFSV